MKTKLAFASSRPAFPRTTSRAQLSPLSRSITRDAALRGLTVSASSLDAPAYYWDTHVVDRLHTPLTRYHE